MFYVSYMQIKSKCRHKLYLIKELTYFLHEEVAFIGMTAFRTEMMVTVLLTSL